MRRRAAPKREILPDPKYHSVLLARFINQLMERGKKSIAEKVVYQALEIFADKMKLKDKQGNAGEELASPVLEVFSEMLDKVSPNVEVRSRRVGGSTYQVPVEVRPSRRRTLGMRWIIAAARDRKARCMAEGLADEMMDALAGRGAAIKRLEETIRMAKANQAFAHFRW